MFIFLIQTSSVATPCVHHHSNLKKRKHFSLSSSQVITRLLHGWFIRSVYTKLTGCSVQCTVPLIVAVCAYLKAPLHSLILLIHSALISLLPEPSVDASITLSPFRARRSYLKIFLVSTVPFLLFRCTHFPSHPISNILVHPTYSPPNPQFQSRLISECPALSSM